MDLSIWTVVFLVAMFFLAGFVDSIAGGGGLIAVPSLLVAGIPSAIALGTNKMAATPGTISALINYARNGLVMWRIGLIGIPFCIIGSAIGTNTLLIFDNETIGKIIIFLLPVGIIANFIPKKATSVQAVISPIKLYLVAPLVCLVIGFYDGFFGPGAGSFFVIAFHYIVGMELVKATATAKLFNAVTGVSALIVFAINGQFILWLAIPLAIANIAGSLIGSQLAIKIGAAFIKKILSASLLLLFVTLIWKFFIAG
ncbi:MAG: TSUP family transporter [Deferribacteraceae bacterium]|jgi:uncharacterized membrane protein YfcA|nr:TSUP family transporter [Deferribacteraceae bacterium]